LSYRATKSIMSYAHKTLRKRLLQAWRASVVALLPSLFVTALSGASTIKIPGELREFHHVHVIQPIEDKTVITGKELSFSLNVSRHLGGEIEFSSNFLPEGASFDPENLTFSWTPSSRDEGTYFGVRFNAVNGKVMDSQAVKITVVKVGVEEKLQKTSSRGKDTGGGSGISQAGPRTSASTQQPSSGNEKPQSGKAAQETQAEKQSAKEEQIQKEQVEQQENQEEAQTVSEDEPEKQENESGDSAGASSGGVPLSSATLDNSPSPNTQSVEPSQTPAAQNTEDQATPTTTSTPTQYVSPTATPTSTPEPWFRDVTSATGVGDLNLACYDAAFFDYDDDGYPDLYVSGGRLYHNEGGPSFSVVTSPALPAAMEKVITGDCDSDGDTDLFLVSLESPPACTSLNALLENESGLFTNVTDHAGLKYGNSDQRGAVFLDVDVDGYNDLFVLANGSSILYRGRGNGSFVNITSTLALEDWSGARDVSVLDYDSDGLPDLLVVFDDTAPGANKCRLYRNNGNLGFSEVSSAAGLNASLPVRAIAIGDCDDDGDPDIYLVRSGENALYQNDGGVFSKVTDSAGVGDAGDGYDAAWGDFDNDGDLDLYVVNDGSNLLYRNGENGTYADVSSLSGANDAGDGRAVCVADYNGDGYLDLYVVNEASPNVLYKNVQSGSNWIKVRLEGGNGVCAPIGVQIDAEIPDHSPMSRWVGNRPGDDATVHFGLGSRETVTSLSIIWPQGLTVTSINIDANQVISQQAPDTAVYVDGSVPGPGAGTKDNPYPCIQDAIDAPSISGIIKIASGSYNEHLFLNPGIRIYGGYSFPAWEREDISIKTTVTGVDPLDYSIDMYDNCVVDGLTVNGFNGIYCGGKKGITITGCEITVTNVGIYTCLSDDPHILANIIYDNSSNNGIEIVQNASPIIYGNLIGSHGISSGICCGDTSTPVIINNTIVDSDWWGIRSEGDAEPMIVNNIITGNGIAGIRWNSTAPFDAIRYNDVRGNAVDYEGMPDPTGTNGNISKDPQYVGGTPFDYGIPAASPAADAGLSGYFMGAFSPGQ